MRIEPSDLLTLCFDDAPVGIALADVEGRHLRANAAFHRLTGRDEDELAGTTVEQLLDPEDAPDAARAIADLLSGRSAAVQDERRLLRPDGSRLWVLLSSSLHHDWRGRPSVVIHHLQDVSEQRRSRDAVLAGERALRGMLDAVSDYGIFLLDAEGRVASWTRGARRITGWEAEDIVGRSFAVFYPPEERSDGKPERELAEAAASGRYEEQGWRVRRDGSRYWSDVVLTAIRDQSGALTGFAKVTRDATERKRIEERMERSREEAAIANRSKSEFLSRMSHELRTPLNSIIGFTELLALDEPHEDRREALESVLRAGEHLLNLINEVLDISRIEAGNLAMSMEPVPVKEVIAEATGLMAPQAAKRDITISVELADAERAMVTADKQRLKQALLNLLSNAIKYNREAGAVRVRTVCDGDRLRIEVRDTGSGIPADRMPLLFRPFERLGADRNIEGTGLGLALSRNLVEAMGGGIEAVSWPGVGTAFTIDLALAAMMAEAELTGEAVAPHERWGGAAARTILYIEDNLSNLRLVERILARRPHTTVISAMQGSLGLELAREHRPDLVLLDLNLPDMNGEEVLRRLRREPATERIPVVVISADATRGQTERLLSAGAAAYVAKPLKVREFLSAVDVQLGSHAPAASRE